MDLENCMEHKKIILTFLWLCGYNQSCLLNKKKLTKNQSYLNIFNRPSKMEKKNAFQK